MKTLQLMHKAVEQEFAVKVELVPTASGRQRDDIIGVVTFYTDVLGFVGIIDAISDQIHYLSTSEIRRIARTAEVNRTDAYDQVSLAYDRLQFAVISEVKQRYDDFMEFLELNKFYFTDFEIRCIEEDLKQYEEIIKEVQS